ncbi:hypothetical protein J6590_095478 [Homalodisca vitripennis]|nr:hypothetical protein J6590_041477 [Homalodisca vitripennis]KAG8304370.1 hypothetical protein J6590_095478 [Homalodisca vitripennis]
MAVESVGRAMADAKIDRSEIQQACVGYVYVNSRVKWCTVALFTLNIRFDTRTRHAIE